jgi:hypothetical protein
MFLKILFWRIMAVILMELSKLVRGGAWFKRDSINYMLVFFFLITWGFKQRFKNWKTFVRLPVLFRFV